MKIFDKSIEIARAMFPVDISTEVRRCIHFSFLWDKNRLMVVGENKQATHTRNKFNLRNFSIDLKNQCSEMRAFLAAKSKFDKLNWKKIKMVNVRLDRNGKIKNSKCCPACQNLVKYLGLRDIYHTTDEGNFDKYEI